MISLGVPMFLWLWVTAGLLVLSVLGFFYVLRDVRRRRHHVRHPAHLFCCGRCGRVYVGGSGEKAAACPACGHLNGSVRSV